MSPAATSSIGCVLVVFWDDLATFFDSVLHLDVEGVRRTPRMDAILSRWSGRAKPCTMLSVTNFLSRFCCWMDCTLVIAKIEGFFDT